MLELTLPFPPTVNHYWRRVGNRTVISKRGRLYRRHVATAVLLAGADYELKCRLSVLIKAYPPDRRKRDLDNLMKASLDAMSKAGVYEDDELIDDLRIVRRHVVRLGKLEVEITPCN